MKAIFSCKLYRSSPRQAKIQCAISNPINAELVAQLAEYLDEEYQTPQYVGDAETSGNENAADSEISESSSDSSTTMPHSVPSHISPVSFTPSGGAFDIPDEQVLEDTESTDSESDAGAFDAADMDEVDNAGEIADDVTEPAEIDDVEDVASANELSQLDTVTGESCTCDVVTQDTIEQIRGMLNNRADTCNVNRVLLKDNELWIHYDDSINLNNVMGPVIELLNASGYTYLDFNRLARSANAIVFQISSTDSDRAIQPMEVTDNE